MTAASTAAAIADPGLDERVRLADERVLQAVGDEARRVALEADRRLARGAAPGDELLHRGRRGRRRGDDLDELDELGRVEPVQRREAARVAQGLAQRGERERGGVRREQRVRRRGRLRTPEHLGLDREILDDRLHDERSARDGLVAVGHQLDPRAGGAGRVAGQPAVGDQRVEAGGEPPPRAVARRLPARVDADERAREREGQGDAAPHRAGAEHADSRRGLAHGQNPRSSRCASRTAPAWATWSLIARRAAAPSPRASASRIATCSARLSSRASSADVMARQT